MPDWQLATAFPRLDDVPATWGYDIRGTLDPAVALVTPPPAEPKPTPQYEPAQCGDFPAITRLDGQNTSAFAAALNLTGADSQNSTGPTEFKLWKSAPQAQELIRQYADWARSCHTYRYVYPGGLESTVTLRVETPTIEGVEAVVVDQSSTARDDAGTTSSRKFDGYYAVKGTLLQVKSPDSGTAADSVKRLAVATTEKLRTLTEPPWPIAPGLAALSAPELADLLPDAAAFPSGWTTSRAPADDLLGKLGEFGYTDNRDVDKHLRPPECSMLLTAQDSRPAAASAYGQSSPRSVGRRSIYDIHLTVARDFEPAAVDTLHQHTQRCGKFTNDEGGQFTSTVKTDDSPQRFSYQLTRPAGGPSDEGYPTYFSYAQVRDLIVIGQATAGNEELLDRVMQTTLDRIAHR